MKLIRQGIDMEITHSNIDKKVIDKIKTITLSLLAFNISTSLYAQDADIVVTGSMIEQTIPEAPASISVVSEKEFNKRPIHNIADALQYAEGVVLSPDNNQGIMLRGLNPDYTLILINGKRLNSKYLSVRHNDDTDLSWISPSEIQRVEVVRGPMATLYGADAMGGVVNIITKKVKDKWRNYIDASYTLSDDSTQGNTNQVNIGTSGSIIEDKLKLKLNARRSERERPQYGYTNDGRQFPGQEKKFVNGELNYIINQNHELTLESQYSVEDQQVNGTNNQVTDLENKRQSYGLNHNWEQWGMNLASRVYKERYDYLSGTQPSRLQSTIADTTLKLPAFESHFFVAGFEYQNYDLDFVSTSPTDSIGTSQSTNNNQFAVFLEDAIKLTSKTTLTLGARNTKNSRYDNYLTPRAYVNYNLTDDLTLKAGVGTGFKAPSLLQLTDKFTLPSCRGACTVVGNPELDPEKNTSYEIGATLLKNNWGANFTIFHTEIKDMINSYFTTVNGTRYRYYRNIDKAETQGIELGGHYSLNQILNFKFNYTYTDSEDKQTGLTILGIPKMASNLLIDYQINPNQSAYTALNYYGEVDRESNSVRFKTEGYTTLNIGYSYELIPTLEQKVKLSLGIQNVANKTLDNTYGFGIRGRQYFTKLEYNF